MTSGTPDTTGAARHVGTSVPRTEDARLLLGTGRFIDDVELPRMLHGAFVRSELPHAHLRGIDTEDAVRVPGVVAVVTGADLRAWGVGPVTLDRPPDYVAPGSYPALAETTVRYIGDPIALIVAESRAAAEDGAAQVVVEYDAIAATGTIEQALADERPPVWEDAGTNVLWRQHRIFGEPSEAFARADRCVRARLRQHRVTNAPMETRGIVASYDAGRRELLCHMATQAPHHLRLSLARILDLPGHAVRVINGDIGGSFGQKSWLRNEDVAVAAAARALGRPVKWIEDRVENLSTAGQARDEYADVEVAVTHDGDILGVRLSLVIDQGAYPIPLNLRTGTASIIRTLFPSAYRIEHFEYDATIVATNKASYTAYRGPWACETWLRERMFDVVAKELGLDPIAFRRRNLWRDDELPRQMATGPTIGGLSLLKSLDALEAHPMVAGFRERQEADRAAGRITGLGVSIFIEPAPGPPDYFPSVTGIAMRSSEPAGARVEPDGSVSITIVQTPGGQGHETTFAQVAADELGLPVESLRVIHGDTALVEPTTFGTAGSRSANATGGAVQLVSRTLAAKLRAIAAGLLEASVGDIELADGRAFVVGSPDRGVTFGQMAAKAWMSPMSLPDGIERGLDVRLGYTNDDCGWTQAVHCCAVEIDPCTGAVEVTGYAVFEDCGDMINPAIVDGQIAGGVVQGIGTVLFERIVYDEDANLQTSTFVDYLVPTATDVPTIDIHHVVGPYRSTVNFRGVGEGGAIASPAAVSNAVEDALAPFGAKIRQLHLAPADIVDLLQVTESQSDALAAPVSEGSSANAVRP